MAQKDYYQVLGVARTATADEIKSAYRKLAAQHHPDRGGSTERFQEIQEAYSTLSDAQAKARYDHGFMNQSTMNHQQAWEAHVRAASQAQQAHAAHAAAHAGFNFESIFDAFNIKFGEPTMNRKTQMRLTLWLTIQDVFAGGKRPVNIGTTHGNILAEIDIPAGVEDGETLHYPNIGPSGADIYVTFRHHPNPQWKVEGANVITEQEIGLWDCILGIQVMVRAVSNELLTLTIPAGTHPSSTLRMKGQGLPVRNGIGTRGDMLVKTKVKMPEKISDELLAQIKSEREA